LTKNQNKYGLVSFEGLPHASSIDKTTTIPLLSTLLQSFGFHK